MRKNKFAALLIGASLLFPTLASADSGMQDIKSHWAEKQIQTWIGQGLIKGYKDGTFKPNHSVTRAEFMTMVNQAMGFQVKDSIAYTDVNSGDWFAEEIGKAKAAGYISGYQDGTIRPNQPVSRQEVAAILAKLLKSDDTDTLESLNQFKDINEVPNWSRPFIATVVAKGYMNGYPDQTFQAKKSITRAEAVVTLDKVLKVMNQSNITPPIGGNIVQPSTPVIPGAVRPTASNIKIAGVAFEGEGTNLQADVSSSSQILNLTASLNTAVKIDEIKIGSTELRSIGSDIYPAGQLDLDIVTPFMELYGIEDNGPKGVSAGNLSKAVNFSETGTVIISVTLSNSEDSSKKVKYTLTLNVQ